ncbi:hypothetical protein [Klebsiella michiganensis]|uniref:hypothetical protein n=1 Tax=Klebsiella michiganensis TaxID=1134687 RepID=UPI001C81D1B1|nr:hypothetical protein [Klebsiella michiganensis]
MSTFLAAVFAVIFTLIAIGQFIWAIVVAYRGLTWFLTSFDDLPHIWKRNWRYYRRFMFPEMKCRLRRWFSKLFQKGAQSGHLAQAAPGGENHSSFP